MEMQTRRIIVGILGKKVEAAHLSNWCSLCCIWLGFGYGLANHHFLYGFALAANVQAL